MPSYSVEIDLTDEEVTQLVANWERYDVKRSYGSPDLAVIPILDGLVHKAVMTHDGLDGADTYCRSQLGEMLRDRINKPTNKAEAVFESYSKSVGVGTLYAATLKFNYDPDLGEWSSMILFDDNSFNRSEFLLVQEIYRGWIGPTAPNALVAVRAEQYWQDMCDLISRVAKIFGP